MSDINTTLLNSIQNIEVDLAEIKQALREIQRQFSNQFAPAVSAEDLTTMQQSIIEQSSLERIAKSVKRAQLTEYPDQLVQRKNEEQKYNLLLQILHEQDWKARCKEVSQGQSLPPLVPLSDHDLTVKRLHLKTLGRMTQQDISDSSLSSPDMSETGDVESPIMADVLSPPPTASVEPAHKRSQRS
ncbi:hypothetical protein PHYBLDRAFT_165542 [Phycomyces blakesleeanus NRRL 1555(-)]|uniref:Uncharacterized protein n=1 Tax=Phycomyces blakesleeanus (strain ATCC 8743b / DSM 1359 / FGSC 10004 / NBRC 33097 / NRRL 1555) TaxID=763407 RepID=A0A167P179_PHYB8|nr:hypothetical protein PHYBLDRAFT_165542 [Phycomyces blakesleeanus NRRL 1555(-)]OAD77051.1 hypothetical protein PHYBLDRAFT_165542 [Phycomyces blakesleeanus NRRL 1555(-)]|eukprot:XP_018295091.1 hypothetical protein PHYBLDRAFT_165542 [Phycomyces blakesleeanus NRRL 1555(-)]